MKVIIVSAVNHDGKDLKVSSKAVELPQEVATSLLIAGAAVKPGHPLAAALFESEEEKEATARQLADAEALAQAEAKALAAWNGDEELRKKHGNDFGVYLASFVKG